MSNAPYVGLYKILQRVSDIAYVFKQPSLLALVYMVFQFLCLRGLSVTQIQFFLLKVLELKGTSPTRRFRFKSLIVMSRGLGTRRWPLKAIMD